jgi:hypothetical protein
LKGEEIGVIDIPVANPADVPVVSAIYPATDTIPENLLKLYIRFSKPMQEGQSLQHIAFIKNGDTVPDVFLDLQRELWSNDRTTLTLWLDPGRIKRDLQPNKNMGPPLQQGERFELLVQKDWRDANGASLSETYKQSFIVGIRDSISPDIKLWTFHLPQTGTNEPLSIDLNEALDYVLLNNCIRITDSSGNVFKGSMSVNTTGTGLTFTPADHWKSGNYNLECKARLEDLAGNNLNRLFDNDLSKKETHQSKEVYKKTFIVR